MSGVQSRSEKQSYDIETPPPLLLRYIDVTVSYAGVGYAIESTGRRTGGRIEAEVSEFHDGGGLGEQEKLRPLWSTSVARAEARRLRELVGNT